MREISRFHIDHLTAKSQQDAAQATPLTSDFAGAPETLLATTRAQLDALAPQILRLSHTTHADPEVAYEERRAVARIVDLLKAHGIEATTGVAGIETALRAEVRLGTGDGPTVGILAEYDALPGLGHACGHNIICAAGVGAFLLACESLRQAQGPDVAAQGPEGTVPEHVNGTLVLYGCPAEEGHSGKEVMIHSGAFAELDAALMVHPFGWDAADMLWLGRRTFTATWHGVSAHASSQPFMGRNALDAASLAYQGIGVLRQQVNAADRVHAIISGGDRASIIPNTATMKGYVRSPFAPTLADLSHRVDDILRGAAMMAGVDVEIVWDDVPASLPLRCNETLAARWSTHQQTRGRHPLPPGVVPDSIAASTDFGNVSHLVPGIHPVISSAGTDVALHTTEFAAAAATDAGDRAALDAAYGLACTALDLLCDPTLVTAVKAEFDAQGGRVLAEEVLATQ